MIKIHHDGAQFVINMFNKVLAAGNVRGVSRSIRRCFELLSNSSGAINGQSFTEVQLMLKTTDMREIEDQERIQAFLFSWALWLKNDWMVSYCGPASMTPTLSFTLSEQYMNLFSDDERMRTELRLVPMISFKIPSMTEIEAMTVKEKFDLMINFISLLSALSPTVLETLQKANDYISTFGRSAQLEDFPTERVDLTKLFWPKGDAVIPSVTFSELDDVTKPLVENVKKYQELLPTKSKIVPYHDRFDPSPPTESDYWYCKRHLRHAMSELARVQNFINTIKEH